MSKHLVKILCICALAILLPLTIVGVALMVTEPVACTLTIEESGKNGTYATSDVLIRVEGEEVEGKSVKVKKHSEITVVFSGEGYDFEGWFTGKADELKDGDTAVSNDNSYKFILRGDTNLTAVRNVIEYQITYSGFLDDGTTPVSDIIAETQQVVEYGETLESIEPVYDSIWGGWYVAASQGETIDATGTKIANFPQKEVELKPVWSNQMIVKYMKGAEQVAIARVSEEDVLSYSLLDGESELVKAKLTKGYAFAGWADIDGKDVASINFDVNGIELYLKEQIIDYSLKVKYNAVATDNESTIMYNVDSGFANYEFENSRTFYTFKGLELDGTLYSKSGQDYVSATGLTLGDVIISGEATSVDVTAVWECEYTNYYISFKALCYYERTEGEGANNWPMYATKNGVADSKIEEIDYPVNFEDKEGEYYFDIEDNAFDFLFKDYENDYHVYGGQNVAFANKIEVKTSRDIQVYSLSGVPSDQLSFRKILGAAHDAFEGFVEGEEITIRFIFNIA